MKVECDGKQAYETRRDAEVVLYHLGRGRRAPRRGHPVAYRCPYCHKFHIGRSSDVGRRAK